jgi:hypothetical protein
MEEFLDIFFDTLRNSVLITGMVTVMMLMIEYINIQSQGKWFTRLRASRSGQVLLGTALGLIPGCMGGFAAVSLYTHRLLGLGALVAAMIASSGDEAFIMLAAIPKETLLLMLILGVVAIATGLIINLFHKDKVDPEACPQDFEVHLCDEHHHDEEGHCAPDADCPHASLRNMRHPSWQRIVLLLGVAAFIVALAFGLLEHEHEHEAEEAVAHASEFNILDEYWLNLLFAACSLFVLWFIMTAKEHFIKEHLWDHVVKKHLLKVFCWTFGTMLLIAAGLHWFDLASWTNSNVAFMILLAVLIGIIPESGPHLLFVTLFAAGAVPFSVLLASSISQDGHAGLPLLAETKRGFLKVKLINVVVALACGFLCYALGF